MKKAFAYTETWYSVQCPNCSQIALIGRKPKTHIHICGICKEAYELIVPNIKD